MNDKEVLSHMIKYVEKKELELQSGKLVTETQIRSTVVKSILEELERVTENENK